MRHHLRSVPAAMAVLALGPSILLLGPSRLLGQEGFSHEAHAGLFPLCSGCHTVEADGSVAFPAEDSCTSCHDGDQQGPVAWAPPTAPAQVDHRFHDEGAAAEPRCGDCHGGENRTPVSVIRSGCAECHIEHHGGDVRCRACHGDSPQADHTVAAHAGCGGSGCHDAGAIAGIRFERELCLLCHPPMLEHKPGRRCGRCHAVGQPGA